MQKVILIILVNLFSNVCLSQDPYQQFSDGYRAGFKEGYCYNKGVSEVCNLPLTVLIPFPKLNEPNTYNQGYNRGFLFSLGMKRLNSNNSSNLNYNNINNYTPPEYVPPVDLKLLTSVGMYKQRLYDTRGDWISKRYHQISDFGTTALEDLDEDVYRNTNAKFTNWFNTNINGQSIDLSDNNVFNSIVNGLNSYEKYFYSAYTTTLSKINHNPVTEIENSFKAKSNIKVSKNNSDFTFSGLDKYGKVINKNSIKILFDQSLYSSDGFFIAYCESDKSYYFSTKNLLDNLSGLNSIYLNFLGTGENLYLKNKNGAINLFDKNIDASLDESIASKTVTIKTTKGDYKKFIDFHDSRQHYYIPYAYFNDESFNSPLVIYKK